MDIAIIWNDAQAHGDWTTQNGDLALDNPLRTAIMVSLFTDRVAPETLSTLDQAVGITAAPDAVGSNRKDRRGWWGDTFAQQPIGSRLWQMQRVVKAGQTAVLREAEAICHEALQWLIDDGIAASIAVAATWSDSTTPTMQFAITVTEPATNATQKFYYSWAWEGPDLMPYARPTLTQLRQQALQDILDGGIPGVSAVLRFSVLYVLSMTLAGLAWLHYGYLDWIAKQAVPWTATDEWLAAWGALKGVTRKAATAAASESVTFTASGSSIIPAGTSIVLTGGLTAQTTADSVTTNGQTVVPATCLTTGAAGNVAAGTTVTLSSPVPGIQTTGIVSQPFTGGADIEAEDDYRTRVLEAYQDSERIGTEADYKQWALAVSGVTRAWIVRNGFGTGTVVIYIMLDAANAAQGGLPQGSNGCATDEARYTTATGDQLRVANALWQEQPVTPLVLIMSPVLQTTDFVISDLGSNNTASNKALIIAALQDMFMRVSGPGVTIAPNQWQEAIAAIGLSAYNIASPSAPIVAANISSMPSLGTVTVES